MSKMAKRAQQIRKLALEYTQIPVERQAEIYPLNWWRSTETAKSDELSRTGTARIKKALLKKTNGLARLIKHYQYNEVAAQKLRSLFSEQSQESCFCSLCSISEQNQDTPIKISKKNESNPFHPHTSIIKIGNGIYTIMGPLNKDAAGGTSYWKRLKLICNANTYDTAVPSDNLVYKSGKIYMEEDAMRKEIAVDVDRGSDAVTWINSGKAWKPKNMLDQATQQVATRADPHSDIKFENMMTDNGQDFGIIDEPTEHDLELRRSRHPADERGLFRDKRWCLGDEIINAIFSTTRHPKYNQNHAAFCHDISALVHLKRYTISKWLRASYSWDSLQPLYRDADYTEFFAMATDVLKLRNAWRPALRRPPAELAPFNAYATVRCDGDGDNLGQSDCVVQ